MPATLTGRRYAQAILEIAQEENKFEEWRSGLKKIAEMMQDQELLTFLESSKLPFDLKKKLVQSRLQGVIPSVLNLAYLLIAKSRFKIVPAIVTEYEQLLDAYYGIEHAKVTTAIPLDENTKVKVVRSLEDLTGHKVITDLEIAPDILGGVIIKIGDKLVDGSLRNKLEALKKSLVSTTK
jgi:F-type H+-transporting ATPase subunit delta